MVTPAPSDPTTARTTARRLIIAGTTIAIAATLFAIPQTTSVAAAATTTRTAHVSAATLSHYSSNMVVLLNRERRAHNAKPVSTNRKLRLSAHRHNLAMAHADVMSHQLPGEAFFANRITHAGYTWQSAGENIGWNSEISNAGIVSLQREMYREKAPDNGHRLNILDKSYRNVGIDIYYDAKHHKLWFTQDFGQPSA